MSSSTARGATEDPVRPEDVEQAAVAWLRAELEDPEITGAENFLDVGGHSLTFSKLNAFLGDAFSVALDPQTTYEESLSAAVAGMRPVSEPTTR